MTPSLACSCGRKSGTDMDAYKKRPGGSGIYCDGEAAGGIRRGASGSECRDAQYGGNQAGDLRKIPGVGANMEKHLHNIGIHCIADLKGKNPEELYCLNCLKKGFQDDRCVLYVFRCAVYFAEHEQHEPEKLKWWYWKDKDYPEKE